MIETNITKRWEQGVVHHPKSIAMYETIAQLDWKHGGDYFSWKSGGDGDNGEHLMYLLDIHFEKENEQNKDCSGYMAKFITSEPLKGPNIKVEL